MTSTCSAKNPNHQTDWSQVAGGMAYTARNVPKVMDGSKTETRRIIRMGKGAPDRGDPIWDKAWVDPSYQKPRFGNVPCLKVPFTDEITERVFPQYEPGDILYIKEAIFDRFFAPDGHFAAYASDGLSVQPTGLLMPWKERKRRLSARYMPKRAARTFIRITDVKCERIQDITAESCRAEGVVLGRGDLNSYGAEVLATRHERFLIEGRMTSPRTTTSRCVGLMTFAIDTMQVRKMVLSSSKTVPAAILWNGQKMYE